LSHDHHRQAEHRGLRGEWLVGRAAVKQAVRGLLARRPGLQLCLAEISIATDERGRPYVAEDSRPRDYAISRYDAANGSAVVEHLDSSSPAAPRGEPVHVLTLLEDDRVLAVETVRKNGPV
jgi:hypothetical protein